MASPAESSTSARFADPTEGKDEGINELLKRLGFEEDEVDDLIFEEESDVPLDGIKWMALARVHTSNYFSIQTFEQHMNTAWSPAKEVKFRALENNLFTIQCFCLGDWLKITKEGPWLFRQNAVLIEPYDGLAAPESVDLNFFDAWVQIHKLPDGYRTKSLVTNLVAKKIGKVDEVEIVLNGVGNFVRARVKIDVRKVLARFVTISRNGQREFYKIQFEKFPKFCGACGCLGHTHLECGTGEHDENKLKWGDFLKADRETWHGRRGFFGGRGDGSGRRGGRDGGRGRGRSEFYDWRAHPERKNDTRDSEQNPELKDTASSPQKSVDVNMTDAEKNARKRLILENEDQLPADLGAKNTLMITDGKLVDGMEEPGNDGRVTTPKAQDKNKRQKGDSNNSAASNSVSAGSFEECRREQ
jgi:hypothetical protein